jgi:ATP-dependent helicase Lhr and Lhr-like helicase
MGIALQYPSFPIVIETFRSCLQDVFDVPALRTVLRGIEAGEVRVHDVETAGASPFARSLVFAYVAAYMYEGDSPSAERRAQALSVDIRLLRELLGEADLRELLDAGIIADVEDMLQRRTEGRRLRDADDVHDALRQLGDLTTEEVAERVAERRVARRRLHDAAGAADGASHDPERVADAATHDPERIAVMRETASAWLRSLEGARRAVRVRVAGRDAWIATEGRRSLPRRTRHVAARRCRVGLPRDGGAAGGGAAASLCADARPVRHG